MTQWAIVAKPVTQSEYGVPRTLKLGEKVAVVGGGDGQYTVDQPWGDRFYNVPEAALIIEDES